MGVWRIGDLFNDLVRAGALLIAISRVGVGLGWRRLRGQPLTPRELGVRCRQFCEQRGLTYRKLGQYLAIRSDLLHPDICDELGRLFDAAMPMPFERVRQILEEELGSPLSTLFTYFDSEPVGSASVAQVHRAVACDGQTLAIKVQRLSVRRDFPSESRLLLCIARFCDLVHLAGRVSIQDLVKEFIDFTAREMDFQLEGHTADRLRRDLGAHGYVPRIRWDLTTSRVLAMEYIEGVSVLTLCRLSEAGRADEIRRLLPGVDLQRLITGLVDACFRQFFETGFFHGDPHPANILVRPDNSFVFIDCGIFGELSPEHRRDLREYIEALTEERYSDAAEYYMRLCHPTPWTDVLDWKRDLVAVLTAWHRALKDRDAPRAHRHMGWWQGRIAQTMTKHHVRMRPNLLLVWRAMVMLDTTALQLPGRFDLLQATVNYFRRHRPSVPALLVEALEWRHLSEWAQGGPSLVRSVNQLLVSAPRREPASTLRRERASADWRTSAAAMRAVMCTAFSVGVVTLLNTLPSGQATVPLIILAGALLLSCARGGRAE